MSEPTGKSLTDVLTRYQALQDLREVWQNGLLTLSKMLPQYRSKADEVLEKSLTTALELVDKQIDLLSDFGNRKFQLMRVIDAIPSGGQSIELGDREEQAREKRRQTKDPAVQN